MEFGEKLKTVREEKGITQQTLADHLFVTRQAVSRWEGGSRYPDLMTAKKIADYFQISLDELISGDDWKDYAEKQPIIENAKTGRIQTAAYAISFILMLIKMLTVSAMFIAMGAVLRQGETMPRDFLLREIPELVGYVILGGLAYGTLQSIRRNVGPKVAGGIILLYLGADIISAIIEKQMVGGTAVLFIRIILLFVFFVVVSLFFFTNRMKNPWLFYVLAVCKVVYAIVVNVVSFTMLQTVGDEYKVIIGYSDLVHILLMIFLLGLGIFQANIITKKRKLATVVATK